MGCDIHMHIEIKISDRWHHYSAPDIDRNYRLFQKLADVRSYQDDVIPISQPRGIPDDCSAVTMLSLECWDSDAHSHSYINSHEIDQLLKWMVKLDFDREWLTDFLFCDIFVDFSNIDKRLVFWFDN